MPVTEYSQLATSSKTLSRVTADTYKLVEQINYRFIVLRSIDSLLIRKNNFKPVVLGQKIDLDSSLTYRANVLEMISSYMQVLYTFSSKDFLKDLNEASGDLAATTQTFTEKTIELSATNSKTIGVAFGGIAESVGKRIIDHKRLMALRID